MKSPSQNQSLAEQLYRTALTPGTGRIAWATQPALHPHHGTQVAVTGEIAETLTASRTRVCVLEGTPPRLHPVSDEPGNQHTPTWSPEGRYLAYITEDGTGSLPWAVLRAQDQPDRRLSVSVPGAVETLAFAPDGANLLLTAAEPLADIGDTQLTPDAAAPQVRSSDNTDRRRRLYVTVVADPVHPRRLDADDLTVWEADWCGPASITLVASPGCTEGDWFSAQLYLLNTHTGAIRMLHHPHRQLSRPRGNPTGDRVAVIEALGDRGNVAGDVAIVNVDTGGITWLDTRGVDVTDVAWTGPRTIAYIGLRGLHVVAGHAETAEADPVGVDTWEHSGSCGRHIPSASFNADGRMAVVQDSYTDYQSVAVYPRPDRRSDGPREPVMQVSLAPPGVQQLIDAGGLADLVSWDAPDGELIQGVLCHPPGPGPYPLILHVHGGPVGTVTSSWHMQNDTTRVLVAAGYAVLHPNPRGSTGRGKDFAKAVIGDMGGADAEDLLAGVTTLVARGVADRGRVGVAGTSYGGYMATWLPTRSNMFSAAVAMSPVTDWESHYYTSNIPQFTALFVGGPPTVRADEYRRISPFRAIEGTEPPTLLMTGARDLTTPPEQAARHANALAFRGVTTQLVVYPTEGHGARSTFTKIDQAARTLAWFDRYLRGTPMADR